MSARDDETLPDTRVAMRRRVVRTTQMDAVASAAARLTSPSADVEAVLLDLYEAGRESGRLQERQSVVDVQHREASEREKATRYAGDILRIRGTAHRLRSDGVEIHPDLAEVIWPGDVQ